MPESTASGGSVLTLNAGSSSIKFALFDAPASGPATASVRGEIESLAEGPHLIARDAQGKILAERHWAADQSSDATLHALIEFAEAHLGEAGLVAIGHRIVHGGPDHSAPALVTPALLESLTALTALDPLHMPLNLAPIRAMASARPDLPQVACFDTAFHHTLPEVASHCALPRAITDAGVRRYGFHGLSYEYIAGRLPGVTPKLAAGRTIVAHLGAGASLCALQSGVSIATTTGFSALDGLMMATRCGSLDPGIILYLARQGHSIADIEDMLYRRSGLLGVSGLSGDLRVLAASPDPHAAEAIALFTYRIACESGALVSALGGLDGLVFTAGIGEHAPAIRHAVCTRLAWLGISLDEAANQAGGAHTDGRISRPDSAITVLVIATDEEAMIAGHTRETLLSPLGS